MHDPLDALPERSLSPGLACAGDTSQVSALPCRAQVCLWFCPGPCALTALCGTRFALRAAELLGFVALPITQPHVWSMLQQTAIWASTPLICMVHA